MNNNVLLRSGLKNFGSTCYINATLQSLFSLSDFVEPFMEVSEEVVNTGNTYDTMIEELGVVFQRATMRLDSDKQLKRFVSKVKKTSSSFNNSRQQDAHEF